MAAILQEYYKIHKQLFEENFQIVLEIFDLDAIHKMRTSTKRLRALFILIEYLNNGKFKAKKQLKNIRTLFKFAGRIRELQIEYLLVQSFEAEFNKDYFEYLNYLKIRERRESAKFLTNIPSHPRETVFLDDQALTRVFEKLKNVNIKKRAKTFIKSRTKQIKKNSQAPPSNERIHQNRTMLKQIYYLYDILTELTGEEEILGMNKERMREIEKYYGDWHDLLNSRFYMDAFFKTSHYNGQQKYKELKKEISSRRKAMRQMIISTYNPLLKS